MFSPFQVEIKPSVISRGVFLLLTVLSLVSIWLSGLSVTLQVVLSLLCGCYVFYGWPRFISLTHHRCIIGLRWLADKKVLAVCLVGEGWVEVEAVQQRLSFPLLLGLSVKLRGARRTVAVVIWPDSVSADQFRKLRVLLRFAPPPLNASHN